MDGITDDAMTAVNRYFSTLSHLGYKKDVEVERLLAFLFLEELLYGPLTGFITEKDYNDIVKAIYCIYGTSCMMPYPDYKNSHLEVVKRMPDEYRITEVGVLRAAENTDLRIII